MNSYIDIDKLYTYRFEIFFTTQLAILFGALFFPYNIFNDTLLPIFYLLGILAGILMISKHKKQLWFFIALFIIATYIFGFQMINREQNIETLLMRLSIYFRL